MVYMFVNLWFTLRMSTNTRAKRHPDADLIDQLGGSAALAALLDYQGDGRVQRVQNWKYRGIPDAVKLRLRYELRPDIFGTGPAEPSREVAA